MNIYIYKNIAKDRLDSYRQHAAVERGLKECHRQRKVVVGRFGTDLLRNLKPLFR